MPNELCIKEFKAVPSRYPCILLLPHRASFCILALFRLCGTVSRMSVSRSDCLHIVIAPSSSIHESDTKTFTAHAPYTVKQPHCREKVWPDCSRRCWSVSEDHGLSFTVQSCDHDILILHSQRSTQRSAHQHPFSSHPLQSSSSQIHAES